MEFLKLNEVELNAANYLVSKKSGLPVIQKEFVEQQQAAEYIVKLSEALVGKNFKYDKIDNITVIKHEVLNAINNTTKKYVDMPSEPKSKVQDELTRFALDFDKYYDDKSNTEIINHLMNQFNKIRDTEEVGEYFTQGVVKLNALYNIKTILKAVKFNTEKLG